MPTAVPSPPRRLHPPSTAPRIAYSSRYSPPLSDWIDGMSRNSSTPGERRERRADDVHRRPAAGRRSRRRTSRPVRCARSRTSSGRRPCGAGRTRPPPRAPAAGRTAPGRCSSPRRRPSRRARSGAVGAARRTRAAPRRVARRLTVPPSSRATPAVDEHAAQRHEERLELQPGDEQAVDQPDAGPEQHDERHGRERVDARSASGRRTGRPRTRRPSRWTGRCRR